jgi:hypothetical protein
MSHFTVLVVGDVDYNLAPFHEFECTGLNDEFVVDVHQLDERREQYLKDTTTVMVHNATGEVRDRYDEMFYRDPTEDEVAKAGPLGFGGTGFGNGLSYTSKDWGDGKGYRAKILYKPDGWVERDVPTQSQKTLKEYIEYYDSAKFIRQGDAPDLNGEHKYGYGVLDFQGNVVDLIRRTNPNRHWDWYVVGGRWSNFLRLKNGNKANSARKGDIDFAAMRDEAGKDAEIEWLEMQTARGEHQTWTPWEEYLNFVKEWVGEQSQNPKGMDWARNSYNEQPAIKLMKEHGPKQGFLSSLDRFAQPLDEYVAAARNRSTSTFAYCENRQWAEKGEMGWWGISLNEMAQSDWDKLLNERIDALPDDAVLTVVDCHI